MSLLLLVALSCVYPHAAAAYDECGYQSLLNFDSLSYSTLSTINDTHSGPLPTNGGFKFGSGIIASVYVSCNGFISMGTEPSVTVPSIPGTLKVVSPYGARLANGTVQYTNGFISSQPQMERVSSFITTRTGDWFSATRMMVVEWSSESLNEEGSVSSTRVQALLITDDSVSYALFAYWCDYYTRSNGDIGWADIPSLYYEDRLRCIHYLCPNTIIYRLDRSYLGMIDITSVKHLTLPRKDDVDSGPLSTGGDFKFGYETIKALYVSSNGYISMGTEPISTSPSIPGSLKIVSPYGANIDTRITGSIRYTDGFIMHHSQMGTVSSFIRSWNNDSFHATRMMVAEWDGVAQHQGNSSTTSTFQAVLITDGFQSYAVFIYECGRMQWGGATIGWDDSNTLYEKHDLSVRSSTYAGCLNFMDSNSIIYRLDRNYLERIDIYSLPHLTIESYSPSMSSGPLPTSGDFNFGTGTVNTVYVSRNGFISMGTEPSTTSPIIPGTPKIVSAYGFSFWEVRYTNGCISSPEIEKVNSFLAYWSNGTFGGTRYMVAQWRNLIHCTHDKVIVAAVQAILITDDSVSYAVFIYECGEMDWNGATIGWADTDSIYEAQPLNISVDCSRDYATIVYKINVDEDPRGDDLIVPLSVGVSLATILAIGLLNFVVCCICKRRSQTRQNPHIPDTQLTKKPLYEEV